MSPRPALVPPVAYVMSRFPKLTETFILNEIVALEAAGQPVAIFPLLRERQSVSHAQAAQLAARAHFEPFMSWNIVRDNLYWLCRRPRAYLGAWWEVLRGTAPSRNFFIGALGVLPKSARQARRMQQEGVTHVHAHFATHPAVCALFVHRLTGIPFSFTAHGSDLHVDRTMLARKVEAAAFVVAISQFNRAVILGETAGRAAERIHVVHCGVDLSLFSPSPRAEQDGTFRILCVASFEPVKGHEVLVAACAQLAARGVAFRCDLVGDGPERERIASTIAAQHLEGRVVIHGPRSRDAVAALLADSDAFALASVPTSQGKREGIPVVLMEAMARRLPVVASRLSGIPELIEDGVSGMLVEPRDQSGFAAALEKLAADPMLRERLGRAARATIESRFDQRASAEQLLALIRGVARTRRDAPAGLEAMSPEPAVARSQP